MYVKTQVFFFFLFINYLKQIFYCLKFCLNGVKNKVIHIQAGFLNCCESSGFEINFEITEALEMEFQKPLQIIKKPLYKICDINSKYRKLFYESKCLGTDLIARFISFKHVSSTPCILKPFSSSWVIFQNLAWHKSCNIS